MDWVEILHLRAYSKKESEEAVAAFNQLTLSEREKGVPSMVLLRDIALESDLCILIQWRGERPRKGKSPLGLQMASAFSEFGGIYHSVWGREGRVLPHERKKRDERNP